MNDDRPNYLRLDPSIPDVAGRDVEPHCDGQNDLCGCGGFEAAPGKGHPEFLRAVDEMREVHLLKSGGYGTGADPFANFTAVAHVTGRERYEYPIERIVEKVTRLRSLIDQGRVGELAEEYVDIAGLALCGLAMLREDEPAA